MRKSMFMASAALGAMTAAERQMGRYMRSPDAHPAPAAPAAEAPAEPAPAPEAAPAEPAKAQTTDDLYEAEFGAAKFGDEEGDVEPPAPVEPAEPEAAPAEPEGAADQQPKPDKTPAELALEQQLADAQRERDEARRERDEARAPKQSKAEPAAEQEQSSAPPRPKPDDYEFGEADSAYITDLAEWTADRRFDERMAERDQQQAEKADFAEMQSNWDAQISAPETTEQYPDFQQKVVEGADRGDWHCSPVMTVAIKSSPVARDIAYELANNAAESKRIAALHPNEQILEIGRLEGKHLYLASQREAAPDPTPTPTSVKPSKAPAPPPARARGAGGQFSTELDQTYDRFLAEMK